MFSNLTQCVHIARPLDIVGWAWPTDTFLPKRRTLEEIRDHPLPLMSYYTQSYIPIPSTINTWWLMFCHTKLRECDGLRTSEDIATQFL